MGIKSWFRKKPKLGVYAPIKYLETEIERAYYEYLMTVVRSPGFKVDYNINLVTVDDVVQVLRGDLIPILDSNHMILPDALEEWYG